MALADFDIPRFLDQYWQQRPLVLKQLIPDFEDLIDEHDLAGIAQENDADSRIVSRNSKGEWLSTNGPFVNFDSVCVDKWSLLVRGVERYIDSVDDLFEHFAFIPYWRMDDVMVSYSIEGAGVGAHIDQYDVFLIQGKGQRRWQIGAPGDYQEVDQGGLRQINHFVPSIDVVTKAGDVIYIPPGWPHKGETIEDGLTYSIGYRSPDTDQLVNTMHELLETSPNTSKRFNDPMREPTSLPAIVTAKDIMQLKQMLRELLDHPAIDEQLLSMLSDCHVHHADEAQPIDLEELEFALLANQRMIRLEGIRPLYAEHQSNPAEFTFHINGELFTCEANLRDWLEPLLNKRVHVIPITVDTPIKPLCQVLIELISRGYYFIDE